MTHAHCILDTFVYKYTLRICNIYCLSSANLVARTIPHIVLYVHCLSCHKVAVRCIIGSWDFENNVILYSGFDLPIKKTFMDISMLKYETIMLCGKIGKHPVTWCNITEVTSQINVDVLLQDRVVHWCGVLSKCPKAFPWWWLQRMWAFRVWLRPACCVSPRRLEGKAVISVALKHGRIFLHYASQAELRCVSLFGWKLWSFSDFNQAVFSG
jgi:hypothetical protein